MRFLNLRFWPALAGLTAGAVLAVPTPAAARQQGASALLERATAAVGFPGPNRVLRIRAWRHVVQDYQSDRTYPPYFSAYQALNGWFDPVGGGERTSPTGGAYPGSEVAGVELLAGARGGWMLRDTIARPLPAQGVTLRTRPLNPWAVLADFRRAPDVRVAGRSLYRDYPRLALDRDGPFGVERLLIDPQTAVPVALIREEPHALWGQIAVEYVWSNWDRVSAGALYPLSAFRVVEGQTEIAQTVTSASLIPADSAPRLALPDSTFSPPVVDPAFTGGDPPDTVRAAQDVWLLRSRWYASAIALRRDTVFVLDATTSEARARQDAAWMEQLFPGPHPVVLVVTDLAWPHIGGVRYWVARGATVVSHAASRAFLQRVVDRGWSREPDELERNRSRVPFVFRAVSDSLALGAGAVAIRPIDGISGEGALLVWLPEGRFLWAGDYVQTLQEPTEYAREVLAAVHRAGWEPERFGAEHLPLASWTALQRLFVGEGGMPGR